MIYPLTKEEISKIFATLKNATVERCSENTAVPDFYIVNSFTNEQKGSRDNFYADMLKQTKK